MKKLLGLLMVSMFCLSGFAKSKPFPKKYVGVYTGIQESYTLLSTEQEEVRVDQGQLVVILELNQVSIEIGKYKLSGTFSVTAKTKEYYALEVTLSNGVVEYWNLYRKEKKLLRKPLYPIPATFLFKK